MECRTSSTCWCRVLCQDTRWCSRSRIRSCSRSSPSRMRAASRTWPGVLADWSGRRAAATADHDRAHDAEEHPDHQGQQGITTSMPPVPAAPRPRVGRQTVELGLPDRRVGSPDGRVGPPDRPDSPTRTHRAIGLRVDYRAGRGSTWRRRNGLGSVRSGELDDDRGVVGGALAGTLVAVDEGAGDPVGHGPPSRARSRCACRGCARNADGSSPSRCRPRVPACAGGPRRRTPRPGRPGTRPAPGR